MRSFLHLFLVLSLIAGLSACASTALVTTSIHQSLTAASTGIHQSLTATSTGVHKSLTTASTGVRKSWTAVASALPLPHKHKSKSAPPPIRYAAQTATLEVTFGVHVAGVAPLPRDFVPDMSRQPLWLSGGAEVGVIGTRAGKSMMLGFSGVNLSRQRVVIEDYGAGAPGGRLLDVAISADGRTLATAVETASSPRLEVNLMDTSSPGATHRIASLDGEFDSAQLTWLSSGNIALAVQASTTAANELTTDTAAVPVSGLYLITPGSPPSTRRLDGIKCPLSSLAFSPNDAFAVAQGTPSVRPAIVDIHGERCMGFLSDGPLQVLGWAPSSAAFLYQTAEQNGVFSFDLLSGRRAIIAISSGAAAYAKDGTIIAVGSQELSWQRAVAEPMSAVKEQIALFDPHQSLITVNSLGFATQPGLLAQSTMMFSRVSNDAIIDTALPGVALPQRMIIEYSFPARAAFVLAHGPVAGPVAISWSPNGKQIAIIDGDATQSTLSVIAPPK
jgi:hypothetical protein